MATELHSVIAPIGKACPEGSSALIERVTYHRGAVTIVIGVYPSKELWEVSFPTSIGVKILDERDMPEFWHSNTEIRGGNLHTFLYEVIEGGWRAQQSLHSWVMEAGFYGTMREYWVGGEDSCVSVLTDDEPTLVKQA